VIFDRFGGKKGTNQRDQMNKTCSSVFFFFLHDLILRKGDS